MARARNLLNAMDNLINDTFPELKEKRKGLSRIYSKIIFSNRIKQGYSQEQLAQLAKVECDVVYRAEGGYDNLPTEIYDKIFNALGLSTKQLAEIMVQLQAGNDELAATI